ncbi:MAG: hypothetical protein KAX84_06410 [Burkholderiales bacterium]|nr:hypothetical protein [Betaproteobacteria bacterium]MBP8295722.1 hypothetical protein [Burkholderiales bacterium]
MKDLSTAICGMVLCTTSIAQGVLEMPAPSVDPANSLVRPESGIAAIGGWHCTAARVQVSIDNQAPIDAPIGSVRNDTASVCGGKTNTGFSLLFNYNNLPEGRHTISALADGAEFSRTEFYTTSLGVEFLTKEPGYYVAYRLPNFPSIGLASDVTWVESKQNFTLLHGNYPMSYDGVYYGATLRNGVPQYGQYNLSLADDLLTLSISYADGTSCSVSGKSRVDFTGYLRVDGAAGTCAFCTNFKVDGNSLRGALGVFNPDSPPVGCLNSVPFVAIRDQQTF